MGNNSSCCGSNMNLHENEALQQQAAAYFKTPEKADGFVVKEQNQHTLPSNSFKEDNSMKDLQARIEAGVFIHMLDESSLEPAASESQIRRVSYCQSPPLNQIDDDFRTSEYQEGDQLRGEVSVDKIRDTFPCDISELELENKL